MQAFSFSLYFFPSRAKIFEIIIFKAQLICHIAIKSYKIMNESKNFYFSVIYTVALKTFASSFRRTLVSWCCFWSPSRAARFSSPGQTSATSTNYGTDVMRRHRRSPVASPAFNRFQSGGAGGAANAVAGYRSPSSARASMSNSETLANTTANVCKRGVVVVCNGHGLTAV